MWQSKDAEFLARASAMTPIVHQSIEPAAPPTTTPSTKLDSADALPSGGLSTGSKIGLGIGVPFVIIFGLTLGLCFWRRWKTHQTVHGEHGVNAVDKDTLAAPMTVEGEQMRELHTEPEVYHSRHELPCVAHR